MGSNKKKRKRDVRQVDNLLERSQKVEQYAELIDINLMESLSKRTKDDIESDIFRFQTKNVFQVVESKPVGKTFMAICAFGIRALIKKEDHTLKEVYIVEGTFRLTFELTTRKGISKSDVAAFVMANSGFHAWPYWREFAQNTITRLGYPSLTLPVYFDPDLDGTLLIEETTE